MASPKTKVLKDFCSDRTIHGLSMIVKPKPTPFKIFWILVVATGFLGLTLHLFYITNNYLQHKSTESLYKRSNGYKFPNVTVCNMNGLSSSNVRGVSKTSQKVKYYYEKMLNFSWKANHDSDFNFEFTEHKLLFWALGNDKYKIGHKFQDMILHCSFERRDCKDDDFVVIRFARTFNCYSFVRSKKCGLNPEPLTKHGFVSDSLRGTTGFQNSPNVGYEFSKRRRYGS